MSKFALGCIRSACLGVALGALGAWWYQPGFWVALVCIHAVFACTDAIASRGRS